MHRINYLQITFLVALISTLGSLYFGEVLKYPPCTLCWYQRICMYPLVIILGTALWNNERHIPKSAFVLACIGLVIAVCHNLLYYGVIPDSITPCSLGVSCTTKQIEIFGFITIPLMALVGFSLIALMSVLAFKVSGRKNEK